MWDDEEVKKMFGDGKGIKRYVISEGQLIPKPQPRYNITRMISSTSDFTVAKRRALKHFKQGTNVVVIDTFKSAIVGHLWALSKELK